MIISLRSVFLTVFLLEMAMATPPVIASNSISRHKTSEKSKEDCKKKCDTLYGIQCARVAPNYENYFLCIRLKPMCTNKCLLEIKDEQIKQKVKKLKKKIYTSAKNIGI